MNLYFVTCEGYIKIGLAKNVDARLITLQTGCPFALEIFKEFFTRSCVTKHHRGESEKGSRATRHALGWATTSTVQGAPGKKT